MPDLSLCKNTDCPLREKCYRFMATPDEHRQSYQDFKPGEDGKCEAFTEVKNEG